MSHWPSLCARNSAETNLALHQGLRSGRKASSGIPRRTSQFTAEQPEQGKHLHYCLSRRNTHKMAAFLLCSSDARHHKYEILAECGMNHCRCIAVSALCRFHLCLNINFRLALVSNSATWSVKMTDSAGMARKFH